jgi:hypothetical protein
MSLPLSNLCSVDTIPDLCSVSALRSRLRYKPLDCTKMPKHQNNPLQIPQLITEGDYCDRCVGMTSTSEGLQALASETGYQHHTRTEIREVWPEAALSVKQFFQDGTVSPE